MAEASEIGRRTILLGAVGSALAAGAVGAKPRAAAGQPNILFILADDLGFADLSCYGRRDYETPELDRLARQGMRFDQAYANSAVCSATRTALMTGRYQYRLPVGLEEALGARDLGLPPSHPTLPSLLRRAGYRTTLVGKWHLGQLPKYGPLQSGYDHFWGFRGGGLDYFNHTALGQPDLWDDDTLTEEPGYLTDVFANKAIEVIGGAAKSRQPFFLSLHFNAPHWPWEGPGDEAESQRLAENPSLKKMFHFDGGSLKIYADMVRRLDMQIGRIMAALDQYGMADDTIVIFTSDNGGERFSDTWPFSGKKGELLEGGLRVPSIVRWPRRIKAGSVSDQVTITMDWVSTLLAAAGADADPAYPLDGIDLLPVLAGGAPSPRTLFWRYLNMTQEACRDGDWKYLKILGNSFLFNVKEDPLERVNLKLRKPELFAAMEARFREWDGTMLPLDPAAFTKGTTGSEIADHFGVTSGRMVADDPR